MIKGTFPLRLGDPLISSKEEREEKEKAKVIDTKIKSVFSSFFFILYG